MSLKGTFYQFPLSLLAYGPDEDDKRHAILAWATDEIGTYFEGKGENPTHPDGTGANLDDPIDSAWAHALGHAVWKFTNPAYHRQVLVAARDFSQVFASRHGTSPVVRMPEGIWISWKEGGRTFREFSVLCAVYSVIGHKPFARINRHDIRQRALGYHGGVLHYSTGKMLPGGKAILGSRTDGLNLLTLDQLRYTMDRLEADHLFHRFSPSPRVTIASRSLNPDALAIEAAKLQVKRGTEDLRKTRAAAKEKMRAEVARLRGEVP